MALASRVASLNSPKAAISAHNEDTPPHWFNPERFVEPGFDAESYVADLRRYVPLEALSAELEAHLQVLRNRLVEVINEHYGDFVSLSSKLVNVDSAVIRMQKPLLEIKDKLLGVRGEVTAALDALKEGLERRQSVASAKALLELMQDTAHVMSKVEKLLAEIQAMEGQSPEKPGALNPRSSLDARVRMFERLASEVARLNFYAARGKELAFVEQLEPRMGAAAGRLQELLSQALAQALREGNAPARAHCLQAFSAVGDAASAEQIVREVLGAPLVEGCIEAVQAQRGGAPAGGSSDGYSQVLERLAVAVKEQVGPVLAEALNDQAGLHSFNFLANSVLQEADAQLAAAFPGAFSVGVPEKFVGNYRSAQAFLGRLEALCRERRALSALRDSDAYASFQGRWKLSVYYGLRFQNIAGGLEAAVSAPALEAASAGPELPNPLGLHLRNTLALHHSLTRCIAEDVWLQPLADKFARLALQLLSRFAAWIAAGMDARSAAAAAAPADTVSTDIAHPSGQAGGSWAVGARADVLCSVRADADVLLQWVDSDYASQLMQLMPFLPPEASEGVRGALREGTAAVAAQAAAVVRAAIVELVEQCAGVLKQLRGITATYRMTTRPAPTKASHYVAGILGGLRSFLDGDAAGRLSRDARAEIAQGVIAGVTQRFAAQAGELLENLRKTESSLKRLKKSRAGDAAADGPGALSDADKVNVQLFLDAQEYATHIKRFGVEPSKLQAYVDLCTAVAPPDLDRKDGVQMRKVT